MAQLSKGQNTATAAPTGSHAKAEGLFTVRVANLDCESDARKIERALSGAPGIARVTVFAKAGRVDVSYDSRVRDPASLEHTLTVLGFAPRATPPSRTGGNPALLSNPKVLCSLASGALLLVGWLLERAGSGLGASLTLYVGSLLVGGYFFGREALEDLILERVVSIELLMAVAAVVATIMGAPAEGAMLAFLYSISEAAEGYTEEKTRSAVRALMDLAPKTATVRREVQGAMREVEIPVEEIVAGDIFIVTPGQSMPTDGQVVSGASSVNQAPVTGESVPVEKAIGDSVFAGTINGEGSLEVRATKAFAENTIARIIRMVEEAQERKGTSERFIERFGRRYSPAVLGVGILIAVLPPLLSGSSWISWISRATVFIVAAAPCALVISIPITLVAALGTAARKGVLIKGGVYLEELAKITVVALDKTGTITHGAPDVTDVIPLNVGHSDSVTEHEALAVVAGIEAKSQHPLARAVVRYAEAGKIIPAQISDFQSLTGAGASAKFNGRRVYVGSPAFFKERLGVSFGAAETEIARLQDQGKTVIAVGEEKTAWTLLAIRDNVRPNVSQAIQSLHAAGVKKVVMLTGDNERAGQAIAREVAIDEVHSGLKPDEKASLVRELAKRYGHVAMVGDGVNDAPALAEASVGVAMGAAGTDVALETADVALMADDLEKLVYALRLAQRNQSVVRQNLALSVVVISVLVIGALGGQFNLPVAVIGHELSEFVVIASGLRMLRA